MNCSLPTMPILVSPRRCDDAITAATISYRASLSGRRCNSGCTALRGGGNEPLLQRIPRSAAPRHSSRPCSSGSMSILTTSGGLDRRRRMAGRHVEVDRVELDRDRDDQHHEQHQHHVDQRRRVDVDHDIGVLAGLAHVHCHCFLFLFRLQRQLPRGRRLGDEADLRDAGTLARVNDPADAVVLRAAVAADLHLGLRHQHGDLLQPVDERVGVRDLEIVPVDAAGLVDRQHDVFRLRLADFVALLRQLDRDRCHDDRNRDQEDDQQHQHDVDERRRVDGRDDFVIIAARASRRSLPSLIPLPAAPALSARRAARRADRRRSSGRCPSPPCCDGRASCSRALPAPPPRGRSRS